MHSANYATNVRILFVHEVNWREKVTFEMHELPELLSLRGHDVDFVDFPEGVSPRGFRRLLDLRTNSVVYRSRTYPGSHVHVVTPGRIVGPPIDRLVASFTLVPCLISLLRAKRYDIIVLYAVPTSGWQTLLLANLFKVPVLYRGLDVSHAIRFSAFRGLIKVAERFVYRRSSWLSLNNEKLLEYCVSMGASRARCSVDFAGVAEHLNPSDDQVLRLRSQLSIASDRKIIYFLGSLFTFSGLSRVLDELASNSRRRAMISLIVTGDGDLMSELTKKVREHQLQDCVHLVGRIPFNQISVFMALADVGIIPFDRLLVTHVAFPWKSVQYLSARVPIVASQLDGLQSVFPEGYGVIYDSPERSILDRVEDLLTDPEFAGTVALRGEQIVNHKFKWKYNVLNFEDRFRSVIDLSLARK